MEGSAVSLHIFHVRYHLKVFYAAVEGVSIFMGDVHTIRDGPVIQKPGDVSECVIDTKEPASGPFDHYHWLSLIVSPDSCISLFAAMGFPSLHYTCISTLGCIPFPDFFDHWFFPLEVEVNSFLPDMLLSPLLLLRPEGFKNFGHLHVAHNVIIG